jgi:hypothetical protein
VEAPTDRTTIAGPGRVRGATRASRLFHLDTRGWFAALLPENRPLEV